MTPRIRLAALVGLPILLGAALAAQTGTFRASSDLVVLQVAVHDKHGSPVEQLTAKEFRLWEDKAPQEIRFFVSEDRPVTVGLVVDNSTSMMSKRREVVEAAEAFARSSNPEDQLFLVNFNEFVTFGLPSATPFTSKLPVLIDALATIGARGQTAMFDGIVAGLGHLERSPLDQKVLIVVSDGDDNRSRKTFKDVLDLSLRSNAVIYTVGIFDPIEGGDKKLLRRLADDTGGLALFPEKVKEIHEALNRISVDVRRRYTIGYVPTNAARDGALRQVRVEAVDRERRRPLQVKVRAGYIAQ
jgi:Ca-activated chloride channel family protein